MVATLLFYRAVLCACDRECYHLIVGRAVVLYTQLMHYSVVVAFSLKTFVNVHSLGKWLVSLHDKHKSIVYFHHNCRLPGESELAVSSVRENVCSDSKKCQKSCFRIS